MVDLIKEQIKRKKRSVDDKISRIIQDKRRERQYKNDLSGLYDNVRIFPAEIINRPKRRLWPALFLIPILAYSFSQKNLIEEYFNKSDPGPSKINERISVKEDITIDKIVSDYNITISDDTVQNPFIISKELVDIIRNYTEPIQSDEKKAKAIYDWVLENIEYKDITKIYGYQNTKEVLDNRKGVCGEMAFLYIAMTRCVGLKSSFVKVDRDFLGKRVKHACAMVYLPRGNILVDPAYHRYDIRHKKYNVLSDSEVIRHYDSWRK